MFKWFHAETPSIAQILCGSLFIILGLIVFTTTDRDLFLGYYETGLPSFSVPVQVVFPCLSIIWLGLFIIWVQRVKQDAWSIIPLLLMLWIQLRFSDYHSFVLTGIQFGLLVTGCLFWALHTAKVPKRLRIAFVISLPIAVLSFQNWFAVGYLTSRNAPFGPVHFPPFISQFYTPTLQLSNQHFGPGMDLNGRALQYAQLDSVRMDSAQFIKARMRGASFRGASLTHANFESARLEGAQFQHAQLSYVIFGDGRLHGINLQHASGIGTRFGHALLHCADFRSASFPWAVFYKSKIWAANMSYARFYGGNFRGAEAYACSFNSSDVRGCRFRRAKLYGTDFRRCQIWGSDFSHSYYKNAFFDDIQRVYSLGMQTGSPIDLDSLIAAGTERFTKFDKSLIETTTNRLSILAEINSPFPEMGPDSGAAAFVNGRVRMVCQEAIASPEQVVLRNHNNTLNPKDSILNQAIKQGIQEQCKD